MSIAILHQVFDETRNLAIAGSAVAVGNFRIQKLIPSLEQAGAKAPVFAKLAQHAKALVEGNESNASTAMLELGTLITSILYTQGETGIQGELIPIDTVDVGLSKTQTPAKLLKPLLEALTTKGAGRLEVIRSAFEQGLFHDLRLIQPAASALDDHYAEIADFVADHVLPLYGVALFPELESRFNTKGKGGQVRRLQLMHQLDPKRARVHVSEALEEGNAEMRVAAIKCLGTSDEDLPFLLDQVKAKSKEVRQAALVSLSRLRLPKADEVLIKQIEGEQLSTAIPALQASRSQSVLVVLVDRTRDLLQSLLTAKPKSKAKTETQKQAEHFCELMRCFTYRDDSLTEALHFEILGAATHLKSLPSGAEILESLAINLAHGSLSMKQKLCQQHEVFGGDSIVQIFVAACHAWSPDEVFDAFNAYVIAFHESSGKKRNEMAQKGESLTALLSTIWGRYRRDGTEIQITSLSKRWLHLAIRHHWPEMILQLAPLDSEAVRPALLSMFNKKMQGEVNYTAFFELNSIMDAMIRAEHPEVVDAMIKVIKKVAEAKGGQWILRRITDLPPEEAVPKLEALIPDLADPLLHDVIEYVSLLKNQAVRP